MFRFNDFKFPPSPKKAYSNFFTRFVFMIFFFLIFTFSATMYTWHYTMNRESHKCNDNCRWLFIDTRNKTILLQLPLEWLDIKISMHVSYHNLSQATSICKDIKNESCTPHQENVEPLVKYVLSLNNQLSNVPTVDI